MQQWHANVERDLGHNLVAEIGYLGSKGTNLPFYGDPNTTPSFYDADGVKRLVPGAAASLSRAGAASAPASTSRGRTTTG